MEIFGIIMLILLVTFALGIIAIYVTPYIVVEAKALVYKIKKGIEDKKKDIDKRSEERQHRDEIKRSKDFELANKKLDNKINKVDKKIELQQKKLTLAQELKQATVTQKAELAKSKPAKVTKEELAIPVEENTEA